MTQQIKVSRLGYNVLTDTNVNDFIFDSEKNTFKILATGTYSPTYSSSGTEVSKSFAHGLGYAPFVIAFCKFSTGRVGTVNTKSHSEDFWFTGLRVNATYIKFYGFNATGSSYTPTFRYYITEVPVS